MELGNKIALLRKEKGMTQENLAVRLGISNQSVSKWEAGQCCPDIQLIPEIADIFEISIDELFGRTVENHKLVNNHSENRESIVKELNWQDDNIVRIVAFEGHKLLSGEECVKSAKGELVANLYIQENIKNNVECDVNLHCEETKIEGNIQCNGSLWCGEINGHTVNVGNALNCDNISGTVKVGNCVNCQDIYGDASAGNLIQCADIHGDASSGKEIACSDIGGDVTASGNIACGDINGDVTAGGGIACGDISGDVTTKQYVECGDVEGSINAEQYVECGDVSGDVTAGQYVECGDVSGNVQTGKI